MKVLMTLMSILIFTSYAVAQDDPCTGESGAGYGLCNAYCVAMNCGDPEMQQASDQACLRVAENYEKIMGKPLVCTVFSSPCWVDADEIVTYVNSWSSPPVDDISCQDYVNPDGTWPNNTGIYGTQSSVDYARVEAYYNQQDGTYNCHGYEGGSIEWLGTDIGYEAFEILRGLIRDAILDGGYCSP